MSRILPEGIMCGFLLSCAAGICVAANAGAPPNRSAHDVPASARVLMVSDIHFDPFWDPDKAAQLAAAPESRWVSILSGPASPDRAERFAALQKRCHANGVDTDYALLESSLRAMRTNAAGATFATVSGDLLAHEFSCKYDAVVPHAPAAGYEAFAANTVEFVLKQLRAALPGVPVYAALGNNDSGCGDYRLNAGGAFLRSVAPVLSADMRGEERDLARRNIARGGNYGVMLPSPIKRTRLLVIDDVFLSKNYAACGGKPDPAPAAELNAWLRSRLKRARRQHEKVWVMAHIPPGFDPYSTIEKMPSVCAGSPPATFLRSNALAATLAEFSADVRLAIFGHTHMDELRLLHQEKPGVQDAAVAMKIVPSISPLHGNEPSFVVADVDPASAMLKNYRVIASSNQTGEAAVWSDEYDFDRAYGATDFSPASLARTMADFRADPGAKTAASREYLRNYYAGDASALLKPFWPQYTCALANDTAEGFRSCACAGSKTR
jgi:sphingomyelin phosphodiesterase acid-like 3